MRNKRGVKNMSFIDKLEETLEDISYTENGARGFKTTGKKLLDLNFRVASLRKESEQNIGDMFFKAYQEDKKAALLWLFYVRDIRGGLGERRLFRVILSYLAHNCKELPIRELIPLIPEYGRYDDLYILLDTEYREDVLSYIKEQFYADRKGKELNQPISLLAKWLPSVNTSSIQTKKRGREFAAYFGMTEKQYRQTLSDLRKYLDVVERKMSAGQFGEIDYSAVPSRANLIYKNAFLKHDQERRLAFLESLKKGEQKIHAQVLYPHEIVEAYRDKENRLYYSSTLKEYDETLEQLWKALPENIASDESAIVVADGSGSMFVPIGNGTTSALSVANALAIYFAERCNGEFKDKYITFSRNPQLVNLEKGKNLREKLQIAYSHNEMANTNIYKVFKLILQTGIKHKMEQNELPQNIIIISDMEFDSCAEGSNETAFQKIEKEYESYGYHLPRLIFWNVNSRTNTIPIKENALGVALVSGFSVNILNMVMSKKLDPYEVLLDILKDERYQPVAEVIENIM